MKIIMIMVVLSFVVLGIMVFLSFKKIKEAPVVGTDTSVNNDIDRTQDFLPFEEIGNSNINLGKYQYRAIIKCESISYSLKTDKEQNIIEASFQRFLNSLTHPISILVRTKIMDNESMLKSLRKDIESSIETFPILKDYAENYYAAMTELPEHIGNNKEKQKYIIVPYDDAIKMTNLTEAEKHEESIKELQNRCQIICDGLANIGINTKILNTQEIIELLYSVYHKDSSVKVNGLSNGEYSSILVKGEDALSKINDDEKLDWILYETQLRLETELLNNKNEDNELSDNVNDAISKIEELRNKHNKHSNKDF